MMEKFERGLSGCKLHFVDEATLRKSSSIEYSQRLLKQAKKQKYFLNYNFTTINVPRVLDIGEDYFDMEYISAQTFDTFFETCDRDEVEFILQSLFEYFDFLISRKKIYKEDDLKNKIYTKLSSIDVVDLQFKNYLLDFDYDAKSAPKTFCHGDLTFSNILFNGKRIFLIDFLDSYVNSFLVDLVKLKQDLFYFWSIRINGKKSLRLYQTKRYIWKKISQRYAEYIGTDLFSMLDVINLLRIQPYLTNPKHRIILERLVKSTRLYEEFNHSNGRKIF
jgi:predicted Ser/Thr protein kinase